MCCVSTASLRVLLSDILHLQDFTLIWYHSPQLYRQLLHKQRGGAPMQAMHVHGTDSQLWTPHQACSCP